MVTKKVGKLPTLEDLLRETAAGLVTGIARPNLNNYAPAHEKHKKFHASTARGKLFIGGNRSGKTTSGVVEGLLRSRGQHPFRSVPQPPVEGRVVCVDFQQGLEKIILPEYARWVPPSMLINGSWEDSYSKSLRVLEFSNGSKIDFMSYEQKLEKFAGVKRHWNHFDEEPPKAIFNECKARLMDYKGDWFITMTPVEGMTWTYDDIYLQGTAPGVQDKDFGKILVVEIDTSENSYISDAEIQEFVSGLDEDEINARIHGKYVMIGGLAFKKFELNLHVIPPFIPPTDWKWYASMDHGLKNPTAWLWHAVSPSGAVVTFDELYDSERVVAYYAKRIHERNKTPGRKVPDIYVGDPSIQNRSAETGVSIHTIYARSGIPIVLGNNDVATGVERMNHYLYHDEDTKPLWYITQNCPHLINQLPRMRWQPWDSKKVADKNNPKEKLVKKNDHAPDSARYFFATFMDPRPRINIRDGRGHNIADQFMKPVHGINPHGITIDEYLKLTVGTNPIPQQEWSVIDEHLGGLF